MTIKHYEILTTLFEKEKARMLVLLLSEEKIDFRVDDKSTHGSFKAPLSPYFEADILVSGGDYSKAKGLLEKIK
jgi:hypothetical protein